ncbi:MAG: hypothetical protein NVS2B8_04790 [Vulcanimicrobiaceae bacterium]
MLSNQPYALVMPFLNEAEHLPAVLASLSDQHFAPERVRLIAVDNGSSDTSVALVERFLHDGPYTGEIVRATVRSIPHALNVGLARVRDDEYVVRIDAHTVYGRSYLATIDEAFATLPDDVWCVGGAPTPYPVASDFGRELGIALYSNPLGLGPADFRTAAKASREVSTVYLGAWRAGVFRRIGPFDERWAANEDCEHTERIRRHGGRIFRIPVESGRIPTRGPLATVRQWAKYGYWRMQTFKRYPTAVRPRHVVAPAVLIGVVALGLSRARGALLPLYALYAVATVRSRPAGERGAVTAGTLAFFPAVHVGYALGLLVGLVRTPASMREPQP